VGADPKTGDVGVAVASKFLAVGSVVPFAQAGVNFAKDDPDFASLRNDPEFQSLITR